MGVFKQCITILVILLSQSSLAQESWEWQQEEVSRYFSGLNEIRMQGWGRLNYKVNSVVEQLISDTNEVYRVVPGQTFSIGQAHMGGWIILDISTATKNQDILAFWLAHEWAHQHLGHQANIYNPQGNIWKYRKTPTADEDAADHWAGGFLARSGYPIQNILNHLNDLPVAHGDYAHSNGDRRARIVAKAYSQYGDSGRKSCETVTYECQHQAHPSGDQIQCNHAILAHPQGDRYQCQHACPGPYGAVPCHPHGDLFRCEHSVPSHQFDLVECRHAAHPRGHTEEVCK